MLDPEGVESRRRNQLRRRVYSNPGPNYAMHVDQYDKLRTYGFGIHGAIDGYVFHSFGNDRNQFYFCSHTRGFCSHTRRFCSHARGFCSHVRGFCSQARGFCSHARGFVHTHEGLLTGTRICSHARGTSPHARENR